MTSTDLQATYVAGGDMRREALPLPIVHYPQFRGTFLGFAPDAKSVPELCDCAIPAVENLFRLRPELLRAAFCDSLHRYFPYELAHHLSSGRSRGISSLSFSPGSCHRCNRSVPELLFSDDITEPSFVQTHGWYVDQAYLRLGILPGYNTYLEDVCPAEYSTVIEAARLAERAFHRECERLMEAASWDDDRTNSSTCQHRFKLEVAAEMMTLRQRASGARKGLKFKVESLVQREVGYQQQPAVLV